MENLKSDDLEIAVALEDPIRISWIGESGFTDPGAVLDPYIARLGDAFCGRNAIVDFMDLNYMNSSTVRSIIYLCKLFNEKSIQTTIIYNKSLNWQAVSFRPLESLGQLFEYINVEGKEASA